MRALLSRREKREVYFSHLEAEKCRLVCLLILISDMYLNLEKALKKKVLKIIFVIVLRNSMATHSIFIGFEIYETHEQFREIFGEIF